MPRLRPSLNPSQGLKRMGMPGKEKTRRMGKTGTAVETVERIRVFHGS
jgi:hypothetical protein